MGNCLVRRRYYAVQLPADGHSVLERDHSVMTALEAMGLHVWSVGASVRAPGALTYYCVGRPGLQRRIAKKFPRAYEISDSDDPRNPIN